MDEVMIGVLSFALQKIAENPEAVLDLIRVLDVDKEIDIPINLSIRVMNVGIFWDTLVQINGWEIQKNKITKHARIIDNNNIRRAWGTVNGMYKVLNRLTESMDNNTNIATVQNNENPLSEKLKILKELLDSGSITQEDYDKTKEKILEQLI